MPEEKVFDQCVLPVMTYGAETWTLIARLIHKLQVAQRAMVRAMLGISLRDKIRNEVVDRGPMDVGDERSSSGDRVSERRPPKSGRHRMDEESRK
ncbi:jg17521 [Pararge aegeria aegeria]|uniref:Jg17521 protein n=1 Tax=Pararge aegeria aegeria TaxID=348720 RepID=A0A8S4SCY4_9NEOP|nr:jg17521 [Pararge aegeria aegeria]